LTIAGLVSRARYENRQKSRRMESKARRDYFAEVSRVGVSCQCYVVPNAHLGMVGWGPGIMCFRRVEVIAFNHLRGKGDKYWVNHKRHWGKVQKNRWILEGIRGIALDIRPRRGKVNKDAG